MITVSHGTVNSPLLTFRKQRFMEMDCDRMEFWHTTQKRAARTLQCHLDSLLLIFGDRKSGSTVTVKSRWLPSCYTRQEQHFQQHVPIDICRKKNSCNCSGLFAIILKTWRHAMHVAYDQFLELMCQPRFFSSAKNEHFFLDGPQ